MGQPLGIFGQLTGRRSRQSADVAVDESVTDIGRGVAVLGEPSSELIAASQIVSNTVPSITLLLQGGSQILHVGTARPAAKPIERGWPRKVVLKHKLPSPLEVVGARSISRLDHVRERKQEVIDLLRVNLVRRHQHNMIRFIT
jgi:hypothetical protein